MSKERATRRSARQAEAASRAAERQRTQARGARRAARRASLARVAPLGSRRGRAPGILAAKRRRTLGMLLLGFFVLQVLTWAWTPDWGTRMAVLVASLFAMPLVAVFAF